MATWVKTRLLVLGAVAIVASGFFWWKVLFGETPEPIFGRLGYLEMVPPSNFSGPGTINTIEVTSDKKLNLLPTCETNEQALSGMVKASATVDITVVQKLNKSYDISSQIKSVISEISDSRVKDIFIELKNVKILFISDDHLLELQEKFINEERCQKAIEWNLRNNTTVCQTKSVLEADIVYRIAYKEHVSVSDRENVTRNVAAKFQGGIQAVQEDQILGKGLFFGVRLVPHGILLNTPDIKPADCRGVLVSGHVS
jgi:hypothetical protein